MKAIEPRVDKRLTDIYESSKRINGLLRDICQEEFIAEANLDMQDIVVGRLSIIGEAAAALLKKCPDFCESHSEIPLRQARGMRNVLVHEYDQVDWMAAWIAAKEEIPQLIEAIEPLLDSKS
jgi:uncharacterized protein with HEPN domain